ncbi:MAG: ribonuclease P protein component 4 [Candidatus Micrarchaeia archaeon]
MKKTKSIAFERIKILFKEAKAIAKENKELSKKYVMRIFAIAKHYKIRLPKEIKIAICKKCKNILIPGFNASIRLTHKGYIAIKCECGEEKHIFLKEKSKINKGGP